jgi:hypothetical protein
MKTIKKIILLTIFPNLVFASKIINNNCGPDSKTFCGVVYKIIGIIKILIPILISIAVLAIFYAIIRFVMGVAVDAAKKVLTWSVVGLFFIIAIWGLVRILENTLIKNNSGSSGNNNINNSQFNTTNNDYKM